VRGGLRVDASAYLEAAGQARETRTGARGRLPVGAGDETKEARVSGKESVAIVVDAFKAVEQRDEQRLFELYHPEVEFHWTPSLPFGGTTRRGVKDRPGPSWSEVWNPLQPTEAARRMDPRVVAATEKEVVVHWHQRALSPSGERFDGEALGLYGVRDGKFARAQMFYFDAIAVQRFLAAAEAVAGRLAGGGTRTR
jgi:uncharacterized protein